MEVILEIKKRQALARIVKTTGNAAICVFIYQ